MFVKLKLMVLSTIIAHLPFVPSGCPKFETYEVTYEVNEKLAGKLIYKFTGFTYDSKLEARKKDMAEFYAGGYKEEAASLLKVIDDPHFEFLNKTDTMCTVIISGTFENLVHVVAPDPLEDEFTIRKEDDRLTIVLGYCKDKESKEDTEGFSFTLKYTGNILEHNADEFDVEANLLRWNCEKIQPPGIYFVLELD